MPECDICDDLGIVSASVKQDHPLFGKSLPCPNDKCEQGNQRRKLIILNRFKKAGLPKAYQDMTFETLQEAMQGKIWEGKILAFAAARHFCNVYPSPFTLLEAAGQYIGDYQPKDNTARHSIVFTGSFGVGKTGLVASMFNALLAREIYPLYIRVQDLIAEVQATYKSGTGDTEERFYSIITTPLLILDEFNLENYTQDRLEIVERIIRGRHGRGLPFIATTNLGVTEFSLSWQNRIADIVRTAHWIGVGGEKLRDTIDEADQF